MGWLTNPKKATYNRVYNRTTISADDLLGKRRRTGPPSIVNFFIGLLILYVIVKVFF